MWGAANPHRSIFPFEKTDGLYWPVVQPYDAINLSNIDDNLSQGLIALSRDIFTSVTCADTRNQLVCLTELTYASKQPLLCGRDDEYHFKRFMRAVEVDESSWGPGRFRNRIGYVRVFNDESIEQARARDQAQQQNEADWIGRLVSAEVVSLNKTDDERSFRKGAQPNSNQMGKHVDFNLSDMFSRKYTPVLKDPTVEPHISKGERGPLKVPRNWFEVPIVLYMPTSQRRDYLVLFTNFRNKLTYEWSPSSGESVAYSDLVKYHLSAIKAIFVHQVGDEEVGLKTILEDKIQEKADARNAKIYSELKSSKVSIENLKRLCELEDWEEEYWTIIWDNLASIYKTAPPVSQLQLDRYIVKAFERSAKVDQRGAYFTRFWQIVERDRDREISY
ncbi:hypothetical protein OESDEN_12118 [Oesophagostomum dentatum]|uniref:Uncharacterized protein n=1 Tax=Oesophagostomum dentatum TaxID=61180 RepID=A0A0B1SW19_OESDE|nr:hypothetical protein OESDEN_12118 [Oesophagostomum dentatum]